MHFWLQVWESDKILMPDGMVTIDVISRGPDSTLGVDNSFPWNDVRIKWVGDNWGRCCEREKSGVD